MKGMDMSEVEGMDMIEKQDHPMNHQLGRRVAILWRWRIWVRWRSIFIR
jgi:hypothetical protein